MKALYLKYGHHYDIIYTLYNDSERIIKWGKYITFFFKTKIFKLIIKHTVRVKKGIP